MEQKVVVFSVFFLPVLSFSFFPFFARLGDETVEKERNSDPFKDLASDLDRCRKYNR